MRLIQNIGVEENQDHIISMVEGPEFTLQLRYKSQQLGWFYSITYGTKIINNLRMVSSGNVLHQWRNILPFGIACITEGDQDPLLLKDFDSGRSKLYVLSKAEVVAFSGVVSGQTTA